MSIHHGSKFIAHVIGDTTDPNFINGDSSNFTYKIDLPINNDFNRVCILQANFNKSWYVVETNKNTFTLTEENKDSATITVPIGNYTKTTFLNTLPSLLTTASPNGYTYTISYSSLTSKYTYACSGHTLDSTFTFSGNETIHKLMGFDKDSSVSFSGGTLSSSNIINFQFTNSIHIISDCVAYTEEDVLQEVCVGDIPYLSTIKYVANDLDLNSKILKTNGTNIFRFTITDAENNVIDLKGSRNSLHMTLAFYRRNDIHERQFNLIGSQLHDELNE